MNLHFARMYWRRLSGVHVAYCQRNKHGFYERLVCGSKLTKYTCNWMRSPLIYCGKLFCYYYWMVRIFAKVFCHQHAIVVANLGTLPIDSRQSRPIWNHLHFVRNSSLSIVLRFHCWHSKSFVAEVTRMIAMWFAMSFAMSFAFGCHCSNRYQKNYRLPSLALPMSKAMRKWWIHENENVKLYFPSRCSNAHFMRIRIFRILWKIRRNYWKWLRRCGIGRYWRNVRPLMTMLTRQNIWFFTFFLLWCVRLSPPASCSSFRHIVVVVVLIFYFIFEIWNILDF